MYADPRLHTLFSNTLSTHISSGVFVLIVYLPRKKKNVISHKRMLATMHFKILKENNLVTQKNRHAVAGNN